MRSRGRMASRLAALEKRFRPQRTEFRVIMSDELYEMMGGAAVLAENVFPASRRPPRTGKETVYGPGINAPIMKPTISEDRP